MSEHKLLFAATHIGVEVGRVHSMKPVAFYTSRIEVFSGTRQARKDKREREMCTVNTPERWVRKVLLLPSSRPARLLRCSPPSRCRLLCSCRGLWRRVLPPMRDGVVAPRTRPTRPRRRGQGRRWEPLVSRFSTLDQGPAPVLGREARANRATAAQVRVAAAALLVGRVAASPPLPPPQLPGMVQLGCDFEVDTCACSDTAQDWYFWTRTSGGTPSYGTGPSGDHTTGSGYYLYTEASYGGNDKLHQL